MGGVERIGRKGNDWTGKDARAGNGMQWRGSGRNGVQRNGGELNGADGPNQ